MVALPAAAGLAGTWTRLQDAGWSPRSGFQMAASNGALIVAGGTSGPSVCFNDAYVLRGGAWSPLPFSNPSWSPRSDFAMASFSNGTIVLCGGQNEVGGESSFKDVWALDAGLERFRRLPDAPWLHRVGHSMSACPASGGQSERLILTGGGSTRTGIFPRQYNDVWAMDNSGHWSELGQAPWHARWLHSTTCLSDGTLLLVGGHSGFHFFNDVWAMSVAGEWSQLSPAAPWSPRSGFGMVALSGDVVLVGPGVGSTDFWAMEWTSRAQGGGAWSKIGDVPVNSDRSAYGLAASPNNTRSAILAGGTLLKNGVHNYNDVWQLTLAEEGKTIIAV